VAPLPCLTWGVASLAIIFDFQGRAPRAHLDLDTQLHTPL